MTQEPLSFNQLAKIIAYERLAESYKWKVYLIFVAIFFFVLGAGFGSLTK